MAMVEGTARVETARAAIERLRTELLGVLRPLIPADPLPSWRGPWRCPPRRA
ncbi:hypothetical protein [Inquilinus sp.]|jgi:hypothetical protein|uniref:hypothetical protein n=1 Tax=Inquilinus sp. TaxID=1932117 RepID=UPI003782FD16